MDQLLGVSVIHEFITSLLQIVRFRIHPAPHFLSEIEWTCPAADHNEPFPLQVIECTEEPVTPPYFFPRKNWAISSETKRWFSHHQMKVTVPQVLLDLVFRIRANLARNCLIRSLIIPRDRKSAHR